MACIRVMQTYVALDNHPTCMLVRFSIRMRNGVPFSIMHGILDAALEQSAAAIVVTATVVTATVVTLLL